MKRLRITARPDPRVVPETFRLLSNSSYVTEARLHDWTVNRDGRPTALFTADGTRDGFAAALRTQAEVADAETAPIDDGQFSLLVTLEPTARPLIRRIFDALLREGLVIVKPVVYRDGQAHATVVGTPSTLQAMLDEIPPVVDVTVHEVGTYRGGPTTAPAAELSNRQREALVAALELGYYDEGRHATHADVAECLGCAPSTASEHLKKGEAKLVRAVLSPDRTGQSPGSEDRED
ncbi:helix-turn-helix domain-containing protein [Haloarchaeobius sp. DT45]|uniref:helix-turn-helix domain-containing protein n=1 Tax=Haloarchaeobius sp. DT45 TaxID=3446116 RepID=UPI003F6B4809